jgi:hypothetical protein
MDTRVAAVTVIVVWPLTAPDAALMVEAPRFTAVARPRDPAVLEICATAPLDDSLQVTVDVRSCVELSENVPVAVNCVVSPFGVPGLPGVTAMETSVAAETVMLVEAVIPVPACVAVIVTVPVNGAATPVASPIAPAPLLTDAMVASVENQETRDVISCVELSENVPVAVSCWVNPLAMDDDDGVI